MQTNRRLLQQRQAMGAAATRSPADIAKAARAAFKERAQKDVEVGGGDRAAARSCLPPVSRGESHVFFYHFTLQYHKVAQHAVSFFSLHTSVAHK